jgi:hypothetical protein
MQTETCKNKKYMAQCKQNVQGKYYGTIIYNYGLHEKLISIIIELRKYLVIGSTGKSAPIDFLAKCYH